MSTLNLEYLNAHYEQNDVIPIYDNIPCYPHYDEAVLHMKKDKDNFHLWLVDIINLLYDYNIQATQTNSEIENRIEAKICGSGFDENNPSQIQDIKENQ